MSDNDQQQNHKNEIYVKIDSIYENSQKTSALIDKLYKLIDDNSYCKDKLISEAQKAFANKFLDIADRALSFKNDPSASVEFRLNDLYEEINDLLNELNVEFFIANEGDKFDRSIHQAKDKIETSEADKDNLICKCIGYGYKQNDIVIKPSKVTVFKYIESEAK